MLDIDNKRINDSILDATTFLYSYFKYAGVSLNDFDNIVKQEIENAKEEYNNEKDFIEYLVDKIYKCLLSTIQEVVNDNKKMLDLLNVFVDKEFDDSNTFDTAINNLKKLSTLFDEYDFTPSLDLLEDLIKSNKKLHLCINLVYVEYTEQLNGMSSKGINKNFDDSFVVSLIDAYCSVNSIDVVEEQNYEDDDNIDYIDSTKAYLSSIGKFSVLTPEEEKELAIEITKGNKYARTQLIESNLKLVVSIAKRFQAFGIPLLDLIQDGNLGLIKAVEKFDVTRGYKFSTYATWWIKQAIMRGIADKSRNIRLPVHTHEKLRIYKKATIELGTKLGRKPTVEEIISNYNLTIEEINNLEKIQSETVSLDTPIGDEEDSRLGDFIPDAGESIEDTVMNSNLHDEIIDLFDECNLTNKEKNVLILRYGLNGDDPMTLDYVGKIYKVTRERIRQIEAKALRKIRKSKKVRKLSIYIDSSIYEDVHFSIDNKESKKSNYEDISLYEMFSEFSKSDVDDMLLRLNSDDLKLLHKKYGYNFYNNNVKKLSEEDEEAFVILKKRMKYLLSHKRVNYFRKIDKRKVDRSENIKEDKLTVLSNVDNNLKSDEEIIDECKKIMDYSINYISLKKLFSNLSVQEIAIVCLKMGYVNGECYLNDTICNFFNITNDKIITIISKMLKICKDNLLSLNIDKFNYEVNNNIFNNDKEKKTSELIKRNNIEYVYDALYDSDITEECRLLMDQLMNVVSFNSLFDNLSVQDTIIISLKMGYVNGERYSTEIICNLLNIGEDKVIKALFNALTLCKKYQDQGLFLPNNDKGYSKVKK